MPVQEGTIQEGVYTTELEGQILHDVQLPRIHAIAHTAAHRYLN